MMNEVLEEVRDLLSNALGSKCKTYFVNEIGTPLKNNMPVIVVKGLKTSMYRQSTAKDGFQFDIKIQIIVDIIPHLNTSGVANRIVSARQALINLIEEEDTDGYPKTDTVLGALGRKSSLLGTNYIYNINPVVNYEVETPNNALYIMAEVDLTFIKDLAVRKN